MIGVVALTVAVLIGVAVAGEEGSPSLRVQKMEDGVWLFESDTDWNGSLISANGLIVTDGEKLLVVDTPWTEEQTGELLDWIDENIGLPVRYYIVTHAHNDRIGGIAEVHRRDIPTFGHEGSLELAVNQGFETPWVTFTDRLVIDLGDEAVTLFYPGPGHAPDNMVVWLGERRWLYGGCFLKSASSKGLGYTGDADLMAWPASLEALRMALPEPLVVIPGHGAVGGSELLDHTRQLLDNHGARETPSR